MVMQEDPALTFSHGHNESTATYGIRKEENLKTSLVTPARQTNEEKTHIEVGWRG